MAKSYYQKYYESHREQEKARTNAYYHEHRDEILARNKEKRDGMPKTKKPTLREKLAITEIAFKLACNQLYCSVENPKNRFYYFTEDEIKTQLIKEAMEMLKRERY